MSFVLELVIDTCLLPTQALIDSGDGGLHGRGPLHYILKPFFAFLGDRL